MRHVGVDPFLFDHMLGTQWAVQEIFLYDFFFPHSLSGNFMHWLFWIEFLVFLSFIAVCRFVIFLPLFGE